jgi:hypothetical protein
MMRDAPAAAAAALGVGLAVAALGAAGCRDLSGFSTGGDSFAGPVVSAPFTLAGMDGATNLCLTLDADHLQDTPGNLSTSDGTFAAVPMRPIPQLWQDPLSTFTFGDGRVKNLLYVVAPTKPFADGNASDVMAVVSLMQSGDVEVRLLRGAPGPAPDGGAATGGNVFAVFQLARQKGPCSY